MTAMETEEGRVAQLGGQTIYPKWVYTFIFHAAGAFGLGRATVCLRRRVAFHAYFKGDSYSGEIPIDADSAIYTRLGMNTPMRNKYFNSPLHLEVVWA
jgi:hypothetical protein